MAINERHFVSGDSFYLSDLSDKDQPWDKHRKSAMRVQDLYLGTDFDCYAKRIGGCSTFLEFNITSNGETEKLKLLLSGSHFCRVRHCPVCQWRRQLRWRARLFEALPKIRAAHPKARFLFLTLTVRNCPVDELKTTLSHMNKSWQRLSQRKVFPAIGFLRSTEITKSIIGEAHPHFHCVMMVNPSYFTGNYYLNHEKWVEMWRQSLQVDYNPSIDISTIKGKTDEAYMKAICETLKYTLKPEDLTSNRDWLVEVTGQLHKTRAVAVGGIFRNFMSEEEPEDLIGEAENPDDEGKDGIICFGWRERVKRYSQMNPGISMSEVIS